MHFFAIYDIFFPLNKIEGVKVLEGIKGGGNAPYTYKTVGKIEGIKVLKGIDGLGIHGLSEESHTSSSYISLYKDGSVKQIRVYNKDHTSLLDIEYSIHQGHKKLHAHDYIGEERQKARDLSKKELAKYKKFFGEKK